VEILDVSQMLLAAVKRGTPSGRQPSTTAITSN